MMLQGFAFFLAALFWVLTAFYGVIASQAFIQEQFLAPRLFPPVAFFADWHAAIGLAMVAPWTIVRLLGERTARVIAAAVVSVAGLALIALVAPLPVAPTSTTSLITVTVGLVAMTLLSVAEWKPSASCTLSAAMPASERTAADLIACLLAAVGAALAQGVATLVVTGSAPVASGSAHGLRLHLLLGGAGFLCLALVRALAELSPRRRRLIERVLTGGAMAAVLSAFLLFVVLASVSIRGAAGAAIAVAMGAAIALAMIARGAGADSTSSDGVADAVSSLAPRLTKQWWGFALWLVAMTAFAAAVAIASHTADWNFVLARTGVVITWMLTLAGAIAVTRGIRMAAAALSFGCRPQRRPRRRRLSIPARAGSLRCSNRRRERLRMATSSACCTRARIFRGARQSNRSTSVWRRWTVSRRRNVRTSSCSSSTVSGATICRRTTRR